MKYCSHSCRKQKPGALDKQIEDAFVSLLNSDVKFKYSSSAPVAQEKPAKVNGDSRTLVPCKYVEHLVFGDPEASLPENKSDHDEAEAGSCERDHLRDSYTTPEPANAPRGKAPEDSCGRLTYSSKRGSREGKPQSITMPHSEKALHGQKLARQREMVRRAARRGCVFGFRETRQDDPDEPVLLRKCEAVLNGRVVEPSFAKGEWSIRWRE